MVAFDDKAKADLIKIHENYGYITQIVKLIEECGELTQALARRLNDEVLLNDCNEEIITEIADVLVLIEQLILATGWQDKITAEALYKIHRQLQRMEEENERA